MRNGLLVALVLVTAACGSYRFPGASGPESGTVSGRVTAYPCAPVESTTKACIVRPVSGVVISFTNGSQTQTATTEVNGKYAIPLAAGTWKVTLKTYMRVVSGPPTVTVTSGSSITADYLVDTGIRAPVPQQ